MLAFRDGTITGALLLGLAACATGEAGSGEEQRAAQPSDDPKVGEELTSACFVGTVSAFADWDRGDGIILRRNARDRFLVTFVEPCFPLEDAQSIALGNNPVGSSCLGTGDQVYFSRSVFGTRGASTFDQGVCRVRSVYRYDEAKNGEEDE